MHATSERVAFLASLVERGREEERERRSEVGREHEMMPTIGYFQSNLKANEGPGVKH